MIDKDVPVYMNTFRAFKLLEEEQRKKEENEQSKCKNCLHYKNEWCDRIIDSPDPDRKRMCGFFSQMTNGDRIRRMTDSELAHIILCPDDLGAGIVCGKGANGKVTNCIECTLQWLQQEVKDEQTD